MKKILIVLICCLTIFTVSCGKKKLDKPNNVAIDESGMITWDKVDNAESYKIIINGQEFVSYLNFYTVEDLSKDFTFYVIAVNSKTTSDASDPIFVKGKEKEIKSKLPGELANEIIRKTKIDVSNKEEIEAVLNEGVVKAIHNGLNENAFMVFKGSIESIVTDIENIDSTKILTLYTAVSGISKEVNSNYLIVYVAYLRGLLIAESHKNDVEISKLNEALASATESEKIDINHKIEAYKGMNNCYTTISNVIKEDEEDIISNFNDCIYPVLSMLKKALSNETIKVIEEIMKSEDKTLMVDKIVQIKNDIIGTLKAEPIPYKSVEMLLDILYGQKETLKVYVTYKQIVDGKNYAELLKFIDKLEPDNEKLAKDLIAKYNNVIDVIYGIDANVVKEAIKYENPTQVVAYLALTAFTKLDFDITISSNDILNILEGVIPEETILQLTGLTNADLTKICDFVAKYLNKDYRTFISNNIDAIVSCLGLEMNEKITTHPIETSDKLNGLGANFYKPGQKFDIVEYKAEGNGYRYTVESYEITAIDDEGNITYKSKTTTGVIKGLNGFPELLRALLEANKDHKKEIVTDLIDLTGTISKITILPEEVVNFLNAINELNSDDIMSIIDDAYDLTISTLDFIKSNNIDLNKFVLSYKVNDKKLTEYREEILTNFKDDALKQSLYTIVDKAADVFEQKNLLEKLGFETKEAFVKKYKDLIDSKFAKAPEE